METLGKSAIEMRSEAAAKGIPNVFTPPELRPDAIKAGEAGAAWIRYTIAKGSMLTCSGAVKEEPYEAVAQRFQGVNATALRTAVLERKVARRQVGPASGGGAQHPGDQPP